MIIKRNNCVFCNCKLKNIFKLKNYPIKMSCVKEPDNYIHKELSFSNCENCDIIQLDKLIPLEILYNTSHNNLVIGDLWKNLYVFIKEIIKKYVEKSNIVELGCPSGKILNLHDNYNKWYIIDPNVKNIEKRDVQTINAFFDNKINIEEDIDLIVHSHLFEHIYNPLEFLKDCYNLLNDGGRMVFAIPNMEHNLVNNISCFGGTMFEHTIFYSTKNVVKYLEQSNFEVLNVFKYKNHSIIFETKKNNNITKNFKIIDNTNYLEKFCSNFRFYEDFVKSCVERLKNTNKNIYVFGASYHIQVVLHLGLNKLNIAGILDNSTKKQNKYLYGFNIKIYNPDILVNNDAIVILKNGVYSKEIKNQIISLNKNTIIIE